MYWPRKAESVSGGRESAGHGIDVGGAQMALVVHDFAVLCSSGGLEACRTTSSQVYDAVVALRGDPPRIACTIRAMPNREVAEDQNIEYDRFKQVFGDQFPYLWIQVRYDPAAHTLADLEPIIERFGLVTIDRWESSRHSFVM